jgi:hypothetical protein
MKIEWETEAPARLQEFQQVLAEARFYYTLHPGSESQTRIWIRSDGKVGGKRMIGRFEMPTEFTWPVCDLDRIHPFGRGWMGFEVDQAFWNACRLRCDYWNHRAKQYVEVA